jgi:hypothetical protein
MELVFVIGAPSLSHGKAVNLQMHLHGKIKLYSTLITKLYQFLLNLEINKTIAKRFLGEKQLYCFDGALCFE